MLASDVVGHLVCRERSTGHERPRADEPTAETAKAKARHHRLFQAKHECNVAEALARFESRKPAQAIAGTHPATGPSGRCRDDYIGFAVDSFPQTVFGPIAIVDGRPCDFCGELFKPKSSLTQVCSTRAGYGLATSGSRPRASTQRTKAG